MFYQRNQLTLLHALLHALLQWYHHHPSFRLAPDLYQAELCRAIEICTGLVPGRTWWSFRFVLFTRSGIRLIGTMKIQEKEKYLYLSFYNMYFFLTAAVIGTPVHLVSIPRTPVQHLVH